MDDSAILDRFFERSENAIMELSAKYGRICLNTAEKITLSQEDAQYENVSTLLPYISGIRLTKEQIYQLANDPQVGWMGSIWTAYNAISTQTRATDSLYLHIHPRRKPGVNV